MERHDRIRYTSTLGVVERPGDSKFCGTVCAGDVGFYERPVDPLPQWHVTSVQLEGETRYCICHESQFKAHPLLEPEDRDRAATELAKALEGPDTARYEAVRVQLEDHYGYDEFRDLQRMAFMRLLYPETFTNIPLYRLLRVGERL